MLFFRNVVILFLVRRLGMKFSHNNPPLLFRPEVQTKHQRVVTLFFVPHTKFLIHRPQHGRTSDEVMKLLRNLVGMGSEAKQIPFSRLLSHWKRRLATTLQRENALFILNTSANILYASNRYTPNQDTYIDEVLNESVHCS